VIDVEDLPSLEVLEAQLAKLQSKLDDPSERWFVELRELMQVARLVSPAERDMDCLREALGNAAALIGTNRWVDTTLLLYGLHPDTEDEELDIREQSAWSNSGYANRTTFRQKGRKKIAKDLAEALLELAQQEDRGEAREEVAVPASQPFSLSEPPGRAQDQEHLLELELFEELQPETVLVESTTYRRPARRSPRRARKRSPFLPLMERMMGGGPRLTRDERERLKDPGQWRWLQRFQDEYGVEVPPLVIGIVIGVLITLIIFGFISLMS
jgi:hypothetical protein